MTVLVFVVILLILLISHELGHFIVAKWSGMKVEEFGIGFPPKLFSKKFGETVYSFNAIPFGAFVKILGEDGETDQARSPRSFGSKSLGKQAAVVVAGVVAHFLLAIILYAGGFMVGMPTAESADTVGKLEDVSFLIAEVVPDSPASRAGISGGVEIVGMTSAGDTLSPLTHEALVNFVSRHAHDEIVISLRDYRTNSSKQVSLVPEISSQTGKPVIGIATARVGTLQLPIHRAVIAGAQETWDITRATLKGYGTLIGQAVTGKASLDSITGPIGIAGIVGDAWRLGFLYIISLTALLSINLAIINLVPFPALDGGRLLFIIIEKIRRRPISAKVSQAINATGFSLLILLMLVITYHDIVRLIAR